MGMVDRSSRVEPFRLGEKYACWLEFKVVEHLFFVLVHTNLN